MNGAIGDIHHPSQEMIEGISIVSLLHDHSCSLALERKLESERLSAKRSHEELILTQKQLRMLEVDFKEVNHDYEQLSKQWKDRLESDQQRRLQYDRDLRQSQEQLNKSASREEQTLKDLLKLQKENEYLDGELRHIRDEYETNRNEVTDYKEEIEGKLFMRASMPHLSPTLRFSLA